MKYLKVWTDFADVLETLAEDEVGRLFLAMLRYAATGEEPPGFSGNERFIWPVAKRDIDTMERKTEILRENGAKGGYAKSKNKQNVANDSKEKQTLANCSLKEKKRNEMKGNENTSLLSDDAAAEIQLEQDRILSAAEAAGFARNDATRAKLIALYADHGLQKVLDGIESCVEHNAPNIAYLRAVLKGEPKKAKADVSAQKYTQRDYADEQQEAMLRMIKGAG